MINVQNRTKYDLKIKLK